MSSNNNRPDGKRDVTLRFLAEPGDVNFGGKVHGGAAMKWIDLAAYACSAGWSGKYCITAYAGGDSIRSSDPCWQPCRGKCEGHLYRFIFYAHRYRRSSQRP